MHSRTKMKSTGNCYCFNWLLLPCILSRVIFVLLKLQTYFRNRFVWHFSLEQSGENNLLLITKPYKKYYVCLARILNCVFYFAVLTFNSRQFTCHRYVFLLKLLVFSFFLFLIETEQQKYPTRDLSFMPLTFCLRV